MRPSFRMMRRWGGLRYAILYQLRDSPLNGAELMEKIEGMSMGWWRPSPGSIYPMLGSMVEEGLLEKRADGRYAATPKGSEEISGWGLPQRREITAEGVVQDMENSLSYLEDLPPEKIGPLAPRVKRIGERAQKLGSRSERG
jgi:DNA-binding PadR family transcriptional regulator